MTTRIQSHGSNPGVALTLSATRVTPNPSRPFRTVLQTGASAVVQGAEAAAQRLPGGQLIAAAVRSDPTPGGMSPTGASPSQPGLSGAGGSEAGSMSGVMQQQAENSMYYLELQQQIQEETRAFTTVSNVLKARHDTVKNAINNVR